MLSKGQLVIISFIILEFLLVFLFILLVYVTKLFFLLRNVYVKNRIKKNTYLLNKYKKDGDYRPFYKIRSADLLLPLLNQTDLSREQKIELVKKIILPKTLQYQHSRNWQKRYRLLVSLKYYLKKQFYPNLILLIGDSIPIVSIEAAKLGSSVNDRRVYKAILETLLQCDHTNQAIYIDNLHKNKAMLPFLLEQLKQHSNSQLKKIIYDLLLHIGCDASFYEVARDDSIHGHRNMRLAAIRILPYTDIKKAGDILRPLAQEEDWLVRNIAVQSLGVLGDDRYIPDIIKLLKDPVWWVRVSAARALVQFGEIGLRILKNYEMDAPDTFTDYAEYFHKLKQLKKK